MKKSGGMNMKRTTLTYISAAMLSTSCLALPQIGLAKTWVQAAHEETGMTAKVVKDAKITIRSDAPFSRLKVGDTKVADVTVLSNQSFHINGKSRGHTSVLVYDPENRLSEVINVEVGLDVTGLKKSLYESFPGEPIEVRKLAGKIYLAGNVSTMRVAEQAEKIAEAFAGADDVTNGLSVRDSHQVVLEVRFVEATRSAIKQLGVGLLVQQAGQFSFASGVNALQGRAAGSLLLHDTIGPTSIDVNIDALEENGVIRTLAEPNLVSMSGETASFLAGGEFPIPVAGQNGQITITYRQFGVGLAFTPTVLDDGVINLEVAPEVSQLDTTNTVRVAGVEVPGLSIRRAKTTVELRNGQSFAIAGLLQNTQSNGKSQVPWLGDVPVLGTLFRSSKFKKNETELVIIITPRLVQPVSDISKLRTPLDHKMSPGDAEFFLGGVTPTSNNRLSSAGPQTVRPKHAKPAKTRAKARLSASYGHVLN